MYKCLHVSDIMGAFVPIRRDFASMARPVSADTANKIIIGVGLMTYTSWVMH